MTDNPVRQPDVTAPAALDIDDDTLYEVLSDSRRRFVLACLDEYATPMALSDIADELAVREHGAPITEIEAEEVKSVYVSLYHVHVPKMEDAGLIEYSQEQDAVVLTESADELPELNDGRLPDLR